MKILVFAENWDGIFKKSSFEAVSYSRELAEQNNYELITLCFNNVSEEELNKYKKGVKYKYIVLQFYFATYTFTGRTINDRFMP